MLEVVYWNPQISNLSRTDPNFQSPLGTSDFHVGVDPQTSRVPHSHSVTSRHQIDEKLSKWKLVQRNIEG